MADDADAAAAAERLGRAIERLEAAARKTLSRSEDRRALEERHELLCREVEATVAGIDRLIATAEAR